MVAIEFHPTNVCKHHHVFPPSLTSSWTTHSNNIYSTAWGLLTIMHCYIHIAGELTQNVWSVYPIVKVVFMNSVDIKIKLNVIWWISICSYAGKKSINYFRHNFKLVKSLQYVPILWLLIAVNTNWAFPSISLPSTTVIIVVCCSCMAACILYFVWYH